MRAFDDANDAWSESFEAIYWDPKWTAGGACICHDGCARRNWLVMSGLARGTIWGDGLADEHGLRPLKSAEGATISFSDWYLDWLNKCEDEVKI